MISLEIVKDMRVISQLDFTYLSISTNMPHLFIHASVPWVHPDESSEKSLKSRKSIAVSHQGQNIASSFIHSFDDFLVLDESFLHANAYLLLFSFSDDQMEISWGEWVWRSQIWSAKCVFWSLRKIYERSQTLRKASRNRHTLMVLKFKIQNQSASCVWELYTFLGLFRQQEPVSMHAYFTNQTPTHWLRVNPENFPRGRHEG